ncbi:hypothetical protein ACA910_016897 [Epithemia clementina (nom. ined.)]
MGDSITEGTIVEWAVEPGQAVHVDDVIAMVETDKVTVEIKAEMDGVLTQRFGNVDETVAVGSPLYEIDTDAVATTESKSSDEAIKSTKAEPEKSEKVSPPPPETASTTIANVPQSTANDAPAAAAKPETDSSHLRTPLIRFLGKEGWARKLSINAPPTQETYTIPAMYGRPGFTEDEMEALMLGGASLEIPGYKSVFKLKK